MHFREKLQTVHTVLIYQVSSEQSVTEHWPEEDETVNTDYILMMFVTGSWDRDSWGSLRTRDRLL